MNKPLVSIIVAVSQNGVIGRDGDMPWRLSSDLKRFKALTIGKPVIMGRKTFESIGKPLPGRPNFIVSRSVQSIEGVMVTGSLEEAIKKATHWCEVKHGDEICIIGGGQIYQEALDPDRALVDVMHVTHVMGEIAGDTKFPTIEEAEWEAVSKQAFEAGERDSHETLFVTYRRNVN